MTKTAYAYDARGNQTQQVQTGTGVTTTTNYGYDLANRLTSTSISNNAVIPLSTSATYAYNAQGQRVTRVEDEVITHFYYTGSALLFTTVNEYVLQTQNILDPTGTIVAGRRFEGQAETGQDPYAEDYFFYRYDIRGSVTTIVDGEGAVVKSYDYDEFGVTTSTGGSFFNEVTFTGSISDASGLLYMNARYYNPATARFLSQDTYTGSAFDPWTQHLYAYCNNNPVNMVDPTGHSALLIALLVAITTTVLVSTGCSPEEEVDVLSDRDYNCTGYAYRLTEHHTEKARRYLKPGEIGNVYFDPMRLRSMNGLDISSNIYETIKADMNAMGYYCADTFSLEFDLETGEMIPKTAPGNWIIAFAYDGRSENESDFHFWRWDGDHWSHKTGVQPASNTDFSGNALDHFYSLERADRGIYTSQLYYFEIGPSPIE